jgi:aspartyl-tRNA(Asn)/glutamyl-tRNA(Gln) amidotransferase subunit B
VRRELPELADARAQRLAREHGLGEDDARLICESRALADFFEKAAARHGAGTELAKWLRRDVLRVLGDQGVSIEGSPLEPEALADLVQLVTSGVTTAASARSLLPELLRDGGDPARLVRERGLQAVSDAGPIEAAVDAVLAEHPDHVARLHGGEEKVRNFLIGQVMKRTGGKADPATVRRVLDARLGAAR